MKQTAEIKNKTLSDDLSYLINLTAFLSDSLDMNINGIIFKNKFMEDILFINNALTRIEKILSTESEEEKDYTIYLKKIKNVKDNLIVIMENILRRKYRASLMLEDFFYDLKIMNAIYRSSSDEIKKKLSRKQFMIQPDNQISREELQLLFIDDADNNYQP